MFLTNLTDEQKTAFLGLAQAMIIADGALSDDEASMMEQYRHEMNIPALEAESSQSSESSIEAFKTASITVKKEIVFELVALACVDNNYADEERRLLGEIGTAFGLDAAFLGECRAYVRELTALYERIGKLVSE